MQESLYCFAVTLPKDGAIIARFCGIVYIFIKNILQNYSSLV